MSVDQHVDWNLGKPVKSQIQPLVRGMDVENDAAGIKERTKKCWYYLEDIHLGIIFMPDSSLEVVV